MLEAGLIVREALDSLGMPSLVKTTGSRGLHVYVPIVRGPAQKEVWTFAKALAVELAARNPELMTAEYQVAKRPKGRVLVDYNQNAWGRTLASIYSVAPAAAGAGLDAGDLEGDREGRRDRGLPPRQRAARRIKRTGDLWKPLLAGAWPRRPGGGARGNGETQK